MNTLYNIYKFISCDQVLHDNVLKIGKRYVCDIVRTFNFVYNIYINILYYLSHEIRLYTAKTANYTIIYPFLHNDWIKPVCQSKLLSGYFFVVLVNISHFHAKMISLDGYISFFMPPPPPPI